jgi:hypothetical protein
VSEGKKVFNQTGIEEYKEKRILVLGSAPHTRHIEAYTWDKLPKILNVADYDVVILNLIPLLYQNFTNSIDIKTLPNWRQFARFVFSQESELIIIGNPDFWFKGSNNTGHNPSTWLPPLLPQLSVQIGKSICNIESDFSYYFKYVRQWFFHTNNGHSKINDYLLREYLSFIHPQAENIEMKYFHSLAETRFQQAIAFKIKFQAMRVIRNYPQEVLISGDVICLPAPTEITEKEAIDLILQERYGLQLESTPPDWVEGYKLPKQLKVETEIDMLKNEIQKLEKQLREATFQLKEESHFCKLLYEQGVEGLETIVRDSLRVLGAMVDDPIVGKNREDGLLKDSKGRKAILEIKGRTKSIALADLRQLDQWVRDALFGEDSENVKGILIGNAYCGTPLDQRKESFPNNCIIMAQNNQYCLLTTLQIYHAICLKQQGLFNETEFWDLIFSTDGACSLPET